MRNLLSAASWKAALRTVCLLPFAAGLIFGQQVVNLAAGPANALMPDGSSVPMWGYSCGAVATGSTATCAALNPASGSGIWSPVVIKVPYVSSSATSLTINLTNNLTFTPPGGTPNNIPTSIMIVGQVGGGLGNSRTTTPSPIHPTQTVTWSTANPQNGPVNTPPPQGPRVQSFATEVAAGTTTALTWSHLKPGTYLLESGTHPSIQGPMGLYGILVVTQPPTAASGTETAAGCAYPTAAGCATNTNYDADVAMLMSEIDPVQNTAVNAAVNTNGFSETAVWSGQPGGCGNPTSSNYLTCYPPAVNYTPLYYTMNGVAFNKNNASGSLFATTPANIAPASGTGSVLVRVVNAGSRMHVPSMLGSQVAGATGATNPIVSGFKVVAEDGNPLPGVPKIKSEVFMAAGKTYDLVINGKATSGAYPQALAIYDRELSLSANANMRDAGMLAYIGINGAPLPVAAGTAATPVPAKAVNDSYILAPGQVLTVTDQSKGVMANDTGVYMVQLLTPPANGSVTMNPNGTFVYYPNTPAAGGAAATTDSFTYCANGEVTAAGCSTGLTATVNLGPTTVTGGITCNVPSPTYTSTMATYLAVKTPGVLAYCKDAANLPLTVNTSSLSGATGGLTVRPDGNGGFTAVAPGSGSYSFSVNVQNTAQQTATATVTVVFPTGSGLSVNVLDGSDKTTQITDYRWIIEEDRTFYVDPNCQTNPPNAGCPTAGTTGTVPTLGVNFHTSYMPFVAQGCTGPLSCEAGQTVLGQPAVCDVGNGVCRPDPNQTGMTAVMPGQVALDPTKRYYISILPGDAANPFIGSNGTGYQKAPVCASSNGVSVPNATCGHGMGGAPIAVGQQAVTVLTQPSPFPPGKLSVFVFEDDFPLNGEQDGGGGVDVLSPNEPGLGGFQIHLWDAMGQNGDFTGQMTYDMFNQPLTNSLAGTKDPATGNDACPISISSFGSAATNTSALNEVSATTASNPTTLQTDPTATGITGMIVTCPKYESDGVTLSPLAGQAVVANLMPGRWGVIATPAADRIARGEEWLQTNTLDGQKAHDVFTRIGEPAYFQEFGPASYHVSIGFANPAIITARKKFLCGGTDPNSPQPGISYNCNNTITGKVTGEHLSRTPDERLYNTGSHDTYYWSQCYVSFGDPDGEDFAFTKCASDGSFTLTGLPPGDWRVTVFDQWNDLLVDGLSTPVGLGDGTNASCGAGSTTNTCAMGNVASTQWQTNLYTRTFIDDNKDGIYQNGEGGIPFANVAVRLRDGSLENLLQTDFTGTANFNETFPLFSWYVVETDVSRYKNTGTHVIYDVGGPVDGTTSCGVTGNPPCGNSTTAANLANTAEIVSVPANLRLPGSVYCAGADCTGKSIQNGPANSDPPSACTTTTTTSNGVTLPVTTCTTQLSSGRIDNPWLGGVEGWQGFPGQNNFMEFGKEPYVSGENGGIQGHVVYASTRPFDDPQMLVQVQWTPLVPHVTMNLYQEGFAADGITPTLTLVDTTQTSSWDDYAQGFHQDANGNTIPNMNCPGQGASSGVIPDLFFFSLANQPNYLDFYNNVQHGTGALTALPNSSQFKCYDGMHNWNQIQPAPYDGMYKFPSVTSLNPTTGKPAGTNCKICTPNTAVPTTDLYYGIPQLPTGKYVVEVVLPPGYELVKEEDKNILIGDNFIAPVTQEFGGLSNIFIIPDQASVAGTVFGVGSGYNANNPNDPTQSLGATAETGLVPGFTPEQIWPCVGEPRIVPDYISLFPQSKQVAPFAGATRNLCDRKEVTLDDQMGAIAKFYIYTSTHIASKFTGGITDDYTSEFDPFSPQFGEKFAPPNMPVSVRDWAGNETNRVYADHWGSYDGMTYSTWEVNPPNPTGYSPTMMVVCMNDPGPIPGSGGTLINDPQYTAGYSQFCYELPFMPGTTQYLDTPVVPTSAFAGAGYNNVDCAYPTLTPAVSEVDGDQIGPWVSMPGHTLTITALGDQTVPNYGYAGPSATTAPFNQKTITRHYGFGTQCGTSSNPVTAGSATCNTVSAVTIGGITAPITGWSDGSITVTVPQGVAACAVQQQAQYQNVAAGASATAQCGELVITAGNGKQSIDAVTVTIGGSVPTHVLASGTIQSAIDAANPGDLIIVDPTCTSSGSASACSVSALHGSSPSQTATQAAHNELVIMWKPVRLQGVGSATSVINANTQPAGKLDVWRRTVNCLFGLTLQGTPITGTNPFDSSGTFSCPGGSSGDTWNNFVGNSQNSQVDPLPAEAILGWDATVNGNLAQLLQEPSLMGALEGAGITVLAKGANFPANATSQTEGAFPTGTTLLTGPVTAGGLSTTGDANALCHTSATVATNPFPSNYMCNPSSIDGLGITDSSQGGGGIFVHAWAHNLQIANNHIFSNAGTLSGGINLGQGEFAPEYIQGGDALVPGSCVNDSTIAAGVQLPYCSNLNVNIHHNNISLNSSTGDELFSGTPAGAGGVSICTGADYYKFNYNWVCGNLSSGDGGGVGHIGFTFNGDIEHNSILFNQSLNPTIPANGGGLLVMGAPDPTPLCGATTDQDCAAVPPGSVLPSDGMGPGLVINANLIMGNAAESGSGGGLRFQNVNGSDVLAFPTTPSQWYSATVTNNIIADNVAGWDGAGVSLLDALNVNIVNNTVVSNSTTASAGILFTTLGADLASSSGTDCTGTGLKTSCPQPSGLVAIQNSAILHDNLPRAVTCPANHYQGSTANNGTCTNYSYPLMQNNIFWQNSAYYIGVGALTAQYQQAVISLYNAFTTTLAPTQPQTDATTANGGGATITGGTGACVAASFWDIGVRGDKTATTHESGVTLNPYYSVLTNTSGYGSTNIASNPNFVSQYCNGSRTPPEFGKSGWAVPPGISDATVPNPIFSLSPVATVDEGNNWVNLRWGPLSLLNPVTNAVLGNYSPTPGSGVIDAIPTTENNPTLVPSKDFFGNPRPDAAGTNIDVGAVEYQQPPPVVTTFSPNPLYIGTQVTGVITGQNLTGATALAFTPAGISYANLNEPSSTQALASVYVPTSVAAGPGTVTLTTGIASSSATFTVALPPAPTVSASPATGVQGQTVSVTLTGSNFTNFAGTTVTVSGTGVTVGTLTVSGGTVTTNGLGSTITTTFTIAKNAAVGARTVTVTTPGGTATTTFTVNAAITIAPTPYSYGNVTIGSTVTNTFTVTNNTTASISTATTSGGAFTITLPTTPFSRPTAGGTCTTTQTLAAAGTCTIIIQYAPTAAATSTGTLTVGYANYTAASASLSGTGVLSYTATLSPASIAFGSVVDGNTSAVSNVTVANTGTGALTIGTITFPAGFARSTTAAGTCATSLASGASCTIGVVFAPTAIASYSGNMTVALTSNPTGMTVTITPASVALTGTGTGSYKATLAPSTIAFGSLVDGTTSAVTNVTVTNTGTGALTIGTISFPTGFSRSTTSAGTCTTSLAAGANCTIGVVFAPTAITSYSGNMTVPLTSNPTGTTVTITPASVALTGTGTASYTATLAPASISFGSVVDGNTSAVTNVTVTNTGTGALTIGALTFPTGFSRSTTSAGTCTTSLAAAANCTIGVVFAPTAATTYSGNLTVALTSNPAGTTVTITPASVALTGTGTASIKATVTPTTLAFGNVLSGSNKTLSVTVTNTGTSALAGGTFTVSAPYSVTTGTGACAATLAVGSSCTLYIKYAPTTASTFNQNLVIAYTGATVTGGTVALTGTSYAAPTLTALTPNSDVGGLLGLPVTYTITLTGTNFVSGMTVSATGFSGVTVTVNSVTVSSSTSATASITITGIPLVATSGTVTVTTPGGTSGGQTFTVIL